MAGAQQAPSKGFDYYCRTRYDRHKFSKQCKGYIKCQVIKKQNYHLITLSSCALPSLIANQQAHPKCLLYAKHMQLVQGMDKSPALEKTLIQKVGQTRPDTTEIWLVTASTVLDAQISQRHGGWRRQGVVRRTLGQESGMWILVPPLPLAEQITLPL